MDTPVIQIMYGTLLMAIHRDGAGLLSLHITNDGASVIVPLSQLQNLFRGLNAIWGWLEGENKP